MESSVVRIARWSQATSRLAQTALREAAPEALAWRVRSALASVVRDRQRAKKRLVLWRVPSGIVRQAGTLAASCALSALLT
jgi:hypothetical protein